MSDLKKTHLFFHALILTLVFSICVYLSFQIIDKGDWRSIAARLLLYITPYAVLFTIFRNETRIPRNRWILVFLLFVFIYLVVSPYGPRLFPDILDRALTGIFGHILLLAGGLVFPVVCLTVFIAIFFRGRRRHQ